MQVEIFHKRDCLILWLPTFCKTLYMGIGILSYCLSRSDLNWMVWTYWIAPPHTHTHTQYLNQLFLKTRELISMFYSFGLCVFILSILWCSLFSRYYRGQFRGDRKRGETEMGEDMQQRSPAWQMRDDVITCSASKIPRAPARSQPVHVWQPLLCRQLCNSFSIFWCTETKDLFIFPTIWLPKINFDQASLAQPAIN